MKGCGGKWVGGVRVPDTYISSSSKGTPSRL